MTQQALTEEHVPLYSRISISAADAAIAILQTVVGGGALTYYYTRVAGLDEGKAGLVWLIFGIWNAINDPLFGFISDRTKSNVFAVVDHRHPQAVWFHQRPHQKQPWPSHPLHPLWRPHHRPRFHLILDQFLQHPGSSLLANADQLIHLRYPLHSNRHQHLHHAL